MQICKSSYRGKTILGSTPSADDLTLLADFGKALDDYSWAIAIEANQGPSPHVTLGAIRLAGVDGAHFLAAYLGNNQRANPGMVVAQGNIGGRDVMEMIDSSHTSDITYIYAAGDTLFYVSSASPGLAAAGLAALQ